MCSVFLFIQVGPGCLPGEHVIRFEIDVTPTNSDLSAAAEDSVYVFLAELPVKERSSVAQLKERLFSHWQELTAGKGELLPSSPASAQHLRIRDGKVCLAAFASRVFYGADFPVVGLLGCCCGLLHIYDVIRWDLSRALFAMRERWGSVSWA